MQIIQEVGVEVVLVAEGAIQEHVDQHLALIETSDFLAYVFPDLNTLHCQSDPITFSSLSEWVGLDCGLGAVSKSKGFLLCFFLEEGQ